MSKTDNIYHQLLNNVLKNGELKEDPNRDVKRLQIPNCNVQFDLREGLPIITTKKMWFKGIVVETLNCLRGPLDLKYLNDNKVKVWNKDLKHLDFTPHIYGDVWRSWRSQNGPNIDQLEEVILKLQSNPNSSDLIVFGDNPAEWKKGVIKSCMNMMQFISNGEDLDLFINYRSWDLFLGAPWNMTQYAVVLSIVAKLVDMSPRHLYINGNNVHIYETHLDAVKEQLEKDSNKYNECELDFDPSLHNQFAGFRNNLFTLDQILEELDISDFKLTGYKSYPTIKAEMLSYNK